MIAIGSPDYAGVVVTEDFSREEAGPVGEGNVVFGEAFFCQRW